MTNFSFFVKLNGKLNNMIKEQLPKIITIVGPTASGKTRLGLELAKIFSGEIISADSRQIYQELPIATARVLGIKKEESGEVVTQIENINHYLLDFLLPDEEYSAALFKKDAERITAKILAKNKLPIIVGGTGLYIKALTSNLDFPKVPPDWSLRKNLEEQLLNLGIAKMVELLYEKYPEYAINLADKKNPRRVLRAFELALNKNVPTYLTGVAKYEVLQLGLEVTRDELYSRINQRVEEMFVSGLVLEAKNILNKYSLNKIAVSGIGYSQLSKYFEGEINLEEAKELIKRDTRHYAKRQMTWFKKEKDINWINNLNQAIPLIKNFLIKS